MLFEYMKSEININYDRIKKNSLIKGNKLVSFIGIAALVLLIIVNLLTPIRFLTNYHAYEGQVLKIEEDTISAFFNPDGVIDKRVTIKINEEKTIVRIISIDVLNKQNITVGDFISKKSGFNVVPQKGNYHNPF